MTASIKDQPEEHDKLSRKQRPNTTSAVQSSQERDNARKGPPFQPFQSALRLRGNLRAETLICLKGRGLGGANIQLLDTCVVLSTKTSEPRSSFALCYVTAAYLALAVYPEMARSFPDFRICFAKTA